LTGIIASGNQANIDPVEDPQVAYKYADEMLKAREAE